MKPLGYLLSLVFILTIGVFQLFVDQRQWPMIFAAFAILFSCYYLLVFRQSFRLSLEQGILLAVVVRIILIPCFPNLSDDIYRFLWDGLLSCHDVDPYLLRPRELVTKGLPTFLDYDLFCQLNSPDYYSVYPPISQIIFSIGAKLSGNNITVFGYILKAIFFVFELGTIYLLIALLKRFKIPLAHSMWYLLNPLVIVEGMGNLHFEIVMIFFTLMSLVLFMKGQYFLAILLLAVSIALKLVSAILWVFLIPWLGIKRWLYYSCFFGMVLVLLFVPLWQDEALLHYVMSLNLYFRTFEFNASLYYLARELGYLLTGYNEIARIGPALSLLAASSIIVLLFKNQRKNLPQILKYFGLAFTLYLLCATTVHPWYLLLLIVISPLMGLRYPIFWSASICLSYYAYGSDPVSESPYILWLEYGILTWALYRERKIIFSFITSMN